uniref:Uncharacterized protein n=1 Tax=viral metagenome TaxID=1070528 RepID=A0A6C0IKC0_9ZZZZ
MESSSSTSWFGSLKDKMSNVYKKAKDAVSSKPESTPLLPLTSGGSKKKHRKNKRTKRVRFSKRNKVYKYKTMRKRK